jgi:hypothetical protein
MSSKKKEVRNNFKNAVFKRDKYTCRCCNLRYTEEEAETFLDAHHITDRNEMPNGGYVKENGISLCKYEQPTPGQELRKDSEVNSCHMKAERFHISEGKEWEPGLHPDELYKLINSSKEEAVKQSEKLWKQQ